MKVSISLDEIAKDGESIPPFEQTPMEANISLKQNEIGEIIYEDCNSLLAEQIQMNLFENVMVKFEQIDPHAFIGFQKLAGAKNGEELDVFIDNVKKQYVTNVRDKTKLQNDVRSDLNKYTLVHTVLSENQTQMKQIIAYFSNLQIDMMFHIAQNISKTTLLDTNNDNNFIETKGIDEHEDEIIEGIGNMEEIGSELDMEKIGSELDMEGIGSELDMIFPVMKSIWDLMLHHLVVSLTQSMTQ